ncbi:MAG TPA: HD domain-containing protein [Jatrophihabitantaceae bacterium]
MTRLDSVMPDEWRVIARLSQARPSSTAEPMLDLLRTTESHVVFEADHLTHQLQTATRAYRSDADDEVVLAALFHDVAEVFAGAGHARVAAELLRPYVRDEVYHVVRTHSDFQGRYYNQYFGLAGDAYQGHSTEPWYDLALTFSDEWDQASFDPAYDTEPLGFFEPMVRRLLAHSVG